MKKKILIILAIVLIVIVCVLVKLSSGEETEKIVTTNENVEEITRRDIVTTLTASGEVKSETTEKIALNTNYYFLTMCVEKNELVRAGSNLLKYKNGKYVTAPYDCVVTDYYVPEVNGKITDSSYINISSLEDLYMDINIGEDELSKVSIGQSVDIVANYDENKTYTGTISKISDIGTSENNRTTFAAIASVKNDDSLKIGMSAVCTITIDKTENVVSVPIAAIFTENDEKYVYVLNGEEKVKTKIETGKADANYVQVISGLNEGDKVYYETQTVEVIESEEEDNDNVFTSLFSFGRPGGNRRK